MPLGDLYCAVSLDVSLEMPRDACSEQYDKRRAISFTFVREDSDSVHGHDNVVQSKATFAQRLLVNPAIHQSDVSLLGQGTVSFAATFPYLQLSWIVKVNPTASLRGGAAHYSKAEEGIHREYCLS